MSKLIMHKDSRNRIVYLDQNAWVALAKGYSDKVSYRDEYRALTKVVDMIDSDSITIPLTASNIYETYKINDPDRRTNMASVQSMLSEGWIFRSRRRIINGSVAIYLAKNQNYPALIRQLTGFFLNFGLNRWVNTYLVPRYLSILSN